VTKLVVLEPPNGTGRSRVSCYALFRLSQASSGGFKEFAETGRGDLLYAQSQGEGGIFDEFNPPPVTSGEGRTEQEVKNKWRIKGALMMRQFFLAGRVFLPPQIDDVTICPLIG